MDFSGMQITGKEFHPSDMLQTQYMSDHMAAHQYVDPVMEQLHYEHDGGGDSVEAEYIEIQNIMVDGGGRFGVSTLAFDTQELLWMGNQGGHVTSYCGTHLDKYTSFQVHASNDIRQLMPVSDRGVLSLTRSALRCSLRRGITSFDYTDDAMQDMQCMMMTSPTSVLIGGHQTKVIELDINKVQEMRQVDVEEPGCAIFRRSNKYICSADTSGKVTLMDPSSLKAEHVLDAHSGSLSDFDLHGNLLVTCGYSSRMGNLQADRFLMVYDLRVMRATPPTQVIIDPMFLRFMPTYSNRLVIVSQLGQFQIIEATAMTPASMLMYQVSTHGSGIMSFDMSSSFQCMAFGDNAGYLHLFASNNNAMFNAYPEETIYADPVEPIQPIHVSDELTPYSIIPMQYPTSGRLLSDWPDYLCQKVYRKPKTLDAEILRSMKIYHNVGYAPNPGNIRRNQVPYKIKENKPLNRTLSVPESPLGRGDDPFITIPKRYRKVEVKYSKFGIEDFDFRHYNKTNFAGLETHIPNAYCNSVLQVLYFVEPLRCSLLSHMCIREFCLTCELGFLFHMLDSQRGQTCQATNFLRAFRTIPEAAALGLVLGDVEENLSKVNLTRLIQSWQRFLHQQVHSETCYFRPEPLPPIKQAPQPPAPPAPVEPTPEKEIPVEVAETASTATPPSEDTSKTESSGKSKKKRKKGKKKDESSASNAAATTTATTTTTTTTTVATTITEDTQPKEDEKEKEKEKEKEELEKEKASSPTKEPLVIQALGSSTTSFNEERKEETSSVNQLFGISMVTTLKCRCGQETNRNMDTTLINLSYPDMPPGKEPEHVKFSQVLQHSLTSEQTMQAWCTVCERYQQHVQRKLVKNLPDVLAMNCQLENEKDLNFWRIQQDLLKPKEEPPDPASQTATPVKLCRFGKNCKRKGCQYRHEARKAGDEIDLNEDVFDLSALDDDMAYDPNWVPLGLKIKLSAEGTLNIAEVADDEAMDDPDAEYYEIFATIAHILDPKTGGNLVAHIKVGEPYHQRKEKVTCTQWYLFNDFSITPVEKFEGLWFSLDWKVPCVIYFKHRNINKRHDLNIISPISGNILLLDTSLINSKRRKLTFIPPKPDELQKDADVVALDAEFVSLKQEEAELRSDGTRSTIKPSHMAVARVTCLRGHGELLGEPFIDDYIAAQEQVVDYLTQFSGIKPGDLDPTVSTKHLTTLKSTYLKLRYLTDQGVRFVGHGLKKDFRVINIVVPKDQIIDTVDLFYLPRQRMISLKFLAWYFLNIKIQSFTHDSIEDARTALELYLKYQEMSKEGMDTVKAKIKEMYEFGRKVQWKIPEIEEFEDDFVL